MQAWQEWRPQVCHVGGAVGNLKGARDIRKWQMSYVFTADHQQIKRAGKGLTVVTSAVTD
jgi:hypothetical protein